MDRMKLSGRTKFILTTLFVLFMGFILFAAQENLNSYILRIISLIGIFGIMAVSLNLINGITGIFSLGHAGFMAIGAYVSSLLTMPLAQKEMTFILEKVSFPFNTELFSSCPFIFATLAGGVIAAFAAFVIGWPTLRLAGDYLAITTLGFSEIIRIFAVNATGVTNGAMGLKGIPPYTDVWWSWGWLLITILIIGSLIKSSYGRALKAIREDKTAAESMGINVFKHQLTSFVVGGFFAGVAGSLYAHWLTTIDPKPSTLGIMLTFNALIMIVLGGLGSISGAVLGAGMFAFFSEWLRFVESDINIFGFHFEGISGMRMLVFSGLFIIVMIFWPKGLMGRNEITWDGVYKTICKIKKLTKTGEKRLGISGEREGEEL